CSIGTPSGVRGRSSPESATTRSTCSRSIREIRADGRDGRIDPAPNRAALFPRTPLRRPACLAHRYVEGAGAAAAMSTLEPPLEPLRDGDLGQRRIPDRGVEIKHPQLRRQFGTRHEALVEDTVGRKRRIPGPGALAPSFAAAGCLVEQATQHIAGELGLDDLAHGRPQPQTRTPYGFELLVVAVETRRIDAPAQPAATVDLVLLGA